VTIYDNITHNTTISSSGTLSHHQKVDANINLSVASGVTLTIPQGITFMMGSNSNLISNGQLLANGSSSNPINFFPISGSSPGSWGYLKFDGSGASPSVLDHIKMSYGREIQCFNGANITIQNSKLSGNQNGIYCDYSSSPTIQHDTIENVQYHSIISFGASSPKILDNQLGKYSGPYYHNSCGLWLIGSSAYVARNTIRGMGFGVYATWSSNPQFTPSPNLNIPTPYPNNYITDNNCGVVAYETSYPVMGFYDPPDPMIGGYNGLEGEPYDVAVCAGCGVFAEQNWWGSDLTLSYQVGQGAWLDTIPKLTTDPFQQSVADHEPVKRLSSLSLPANMTALSQNPSLPKKEDEDLLIRALSLRRHKRYNEAVVIYKKLLAVKGRSQAALSGLADMFRENKDNSILEYFQGLRSNPESYPFAQQDWAKISGLLASMHIQRGEYSTAKQVYDEIITQYPGTSDDRHAKFQKFLLALHIDKDRDAAALILNDLASKFSDGQEVEFAEYLLNGAGTSEKSGSDSQSPMSRKSKKNGIPEKFELSANYPNPFNPSTTIQYAIPQNSYVTLKVFDVLGKEIAALVNEEKSVGFYDVRFDASHLSSGIYFYQIQAGSFRSTKKMILTK
jgi:tetratricopeptide (TPR) repeat protein